MVTHLPLATSHGDVDESPRVGYSLLRPTLGSLLLLLGFNLSYIKSVHTVTISDSKALEARSVEENAGGNSYLWSLRLDFACTGEGSVNFPHIRDRFSVDDTSDLV